MPAEAPTPVKAKPATFMQEVMPKPEETAVIYSSYCNSIYHCMQIFYENKHVKKDGSVAQVEVPADKYGPVVHAMEETIEKGAINGLITKDDAHKLIRKGIYTFKQMKSIARGEMINGLHFDANQEYVLTHYPLGLSVAVTYAISVWSGDTHDTALVKAAYSGIQVYGTTFINAVLSAKWTGDEINLAKVNGGEAVSDKIGAKAAHVLCGIYENGIVIHETVQVPAVSDVTDVLKRRLLGGRLHAGPVQANKEEKANLWHKLKNLFSTKVTPKPPAHAHDVYHLLNRDALELMLKFLSKSFVQLSDDFLLNNKEADWVLDRLCTTLTGRTLRDIYLNENRLQLVDELVRPIIWALINDRKRITPPDAAQLYAGLVAALNRIADE
jgi:hypothetical protein